MHWVSLYEISTIDRKLCNELKTFFYQINNLKLDKILIEKNAGENKIIFV